MQGEIENSSVGYEVFVVAARPYVEKIINDQIFFDLESALIYRNELNKEIGSNLHVYKMICIIDKAPVA